MDDVSYEELLDRLAADDGPDDAVADLVLAAAEGPETLAALLDGGDPPARRTPQPEPAAEPARVHLTEIAVTGFRGVADRARLPFEPGAGLTLVVGRNGSGKSSFAEGLELLLTGRNLRWDGKPRTWKEGWRNLHADGPTRLEATFRVDGEAKPLRVSRTWPAGASLDDADPVAVSGPVGAWEELGWSEPLERYRPLLSYNEIGAMFSERAADLYAALSAVLGLDAFDAAQTTLREARLARGRSAKQEKQTRDALRAALAGFDDARAVAVLEQLERRAPDLDAVQAVLVGDTGDEDVGALLQLARLPVPAAPDVDRALAQVEPARRLVAELEATDAERDARLADLLADALRFHADHGDEHETCPVCGTPGALNAGWSLRAQADVDALRRRTARLREARAVAAQALRALDELFAPSTPAILRGAGLDLEAALQAWDAWVQDREDGARAMRLRETLEAARAQAEVQLEVRDAAWRPVQAEVVRWLGLARDAARDKLLVARLTSAEDWMKACTAILRSERLRPVVRAAQANWAQLRHESNVALGEVELRKVGQQRMAVFDVTVDGVASSAFGVMSQGELSALAVSVFLPRASLTESPFGFMVIDDPVQSMDPAKVDGLARVLADAARERQVVVFTHDERLPQAVDRLGIDARVVDVKRRARSKVEVVAGSRPSERHLREAFALCLAADLPDDVRARVVPGFCRSAIEAACATRIRRRRYEAGEAHADVEARLAGLTSLNTWLAEAFGLSQAQGREVFEEVRRLGGEEAVRVVQLSRSGAHGTLGAVDARELTRGAERLVEKLEAR